MSRQEQARRAVAHKAVKDVLLEADAIGKNRLLTGMQEDGAERIRVRDDDGADLGAVSLTKGRTNPRVVDEAAFLAWVKESYPTEVTDTVRPAFRSKLLGWAKDYNAPITPTGEVIPGLEVSAGDPFLSVRLTETARERVREVLGRSMPELMAGEE